MEGNVVRGKILSIGKFYKWRSQTKKVTIMEWGEREFGNCGTVGRLNNAVLWAYKRKFADKASVAEE